MSQYCLQSNLLEIISWQSIHFVRKLNEVLIASLNFQFHISMTSVRQKVLMLPHKYERETITHHNTFESGKA